MGNSTKRKLLVFLISLCTSLYFWWICKNWFVLITFAFQLNQARLPTEGSTNNLIDAIFLYKKYHTKTNTEGSFLLPTLCHFPNTKTNCFKDLAFSLTQFLCHMCFKIFTRCFGEGNIFWVCIWWIAPPPELLWPPATKIALYPAGTFRHNTSEYYTERSEYYLEHLGILFIFKAPFHIPIEYQNF